MSEKYKVGKTFWIVFGIAAIIWYSAAEPVKVPPQPESTQNASPTTEATAPALVKPAVAEKPPLTVAKPAPTPPVEVAQPAEKPVEKPVEVPSPRLREIGNNSLAEAQTNAVKNAHKSMIDASLRQYEIVKRQGSATDICMHSSMIQGAYLGAEDEANYAKWKVIAANDCKVAGVPSL